MTKFEILQTYSNRRKRDAWVALGSATITETTRIVVEGQIFQVNIPSSAFHQSLVLCTESYQAAEPLNWATALLVDAERGEISFKPDIITPLFRFALDAVSLAAIVEPVDDTFVPFLAEYQDTSKVQIPDDELNTIMRSVGAPFIHFDELEFSREQILDLMIRPALQEYYKWFPKVEIYSYPVANGRMIEQEFPTEAYEIMHIGVNQGYAKNNITNPLLRYFDEIMWTAANPSVYGSRSTASPRTMVGDWSSMLMNRAERQALVNYATRVHHHTEWRDGKKWLVAYSNKLGMMEVHYAMHTLNWNETEFARRPELRRLAAAEVMYTFGSLRGQAKADVPGAVDYSSWVEKANAIRTEVVTDWKAITKYSGIIRGSH